MDILADICVYVCTSTLHKLVRHIIWNFMRILKIVMYVYLHKSWNISLTLFFSPRHKGTTLYTHGKWNINV